MATNKNVNVLIPNGRRQNVKITPDTTILQVLEEACQKHGYNVDDYDAKHYNKILDPNMIFRFSGLPNNAQLEMVKCTKIRSASNITIGIQLESGERLMGQFGPSVSLAQILIKLCPDGDLERAALIYMHREIYGKQALEETSLKSLGLNSGKAMLRLMYRDPDQLRTQAHVYTPLLPKSSKRNDNSDESEKPKSSLISQSNTVLDPISLLKTEIQKVKDTRNLESPEKMDIEETEAETTKERPNIICPESVPNNAKLPRKTEGNTSEPSVFQNPNTDAKENNELEIEFLGIRNALVFNQAGAKALPRDELPDSFFDLTVEDAKTLLRDIKRRREQLEDAPLLTDAQRRLEEDKRTLNQLHKYRQTIIRIQFPDQFVLQGLFGPLETVETVKEFIRNYLEDPASDFTIYTSPPKYILPSNARLIDENLVPSAIIHFSGTASLKSNVKSKSINPEIAGIQALKFRTSLIRQDDATQNNERNDDPIPGPSNSKGYSTQTQNNVPKWFKPSSK